MQASSNCARLIKEYEGFRGKAYKCPAGVWTIGYGFTVEVKEGDIMTQDQANERLNQELKSRSVYLEGMLKTKGIKVNQNQFDALLSLAYNIGFNNLTTSTLIKKLASGDVVGAANEFNKWVYADGVKLKGLITRRSTERNLFLS